MNFTPDYRNIEAVLYNKRPHRLPLYEHLIDTPFIEKALNKKIVIEGNESKDYEEYYRQLVGFWKDMTYDAFSYEANISELYPDHGAIFGGKLGPIQTRDDFNKYPFDEYPKIFWETYTPHLEAIRKVIPQGMKAYGGCGVGIFESSEDLVGYESLATLQYTDPDLFADLYIKIGDLYVELWREMVRKYSDTFVFFRMGDDLGFKTSTLLSPETIRQHIIPQYKRVIEIVHAANKKFLLHSCGNIFSVMDDIIGIGIDAKHSNEDQIAPFEKWITRYNSRIGLFGGIDMNTLCTKTYDEIYKEVMEKGKRFRNMTLGYGLGSGNSIPEYVPIEGFMAMIDAVKEIRKNENTL